MAVEVQVTPHAAVVRASVANLAADDTELIAAFQTLTAEGYRHTGTTIASKQASSQAAWFMFQRPEGGDLPSVPQMYAPLLKMTARDPAKTDAKIDKKAKAK